MNLKRKIEVVMLPTNEKARENDYGLLLGISGELYLPQAYTSSFKPQHLYFLSDEKIKEGDWCYDKDLNIVFQCITGKNLKQCNEENSIKKIIATTDKLVLGWDYNNDTPFSSCYSKYLPQPSPAFIEKYIKAWNEDNPITEVIVDFTTKYLGFEFDQNCDKSEIIPKVDKNNQITITKIKDNIQIGDELYSIMQQYLDYCHFYNYITPQKFIEENL